MNFIKTFFQISNLAIMIIQGDNISNIKPRGGALDDGGNKIFVSIPFPSLSVSLPFASLFGT